MVTSPTASEKKLIASFIQLHQVIHDVDTTLFGVQLVEVHKQKQTRVNDCQKLVGKVSVRNILKTTVTVEDATVVHH